MSKPGIGWGNQEPRTLVCVFSWQGPHAWFSQDLDLPALRSTSPGKLCFWTENSGTAIQWAACVFPLEGEWTALSEEGFDLAREHARYLTALGLALGVVFGTTTLSHGMTYSSMGYGAWSPGLVDLRPTLWDWPVPVGSRVAPPDLQQLVLSVPAHAEGVLELLAESTSIGNPVARFLCIWQALAFHVGTDSPSKIDEVFFDRIGVPRDSSGSRGAETCYCAFRNALSHPRGRKVPDYAKLDSRARRLSDELALLLLRDVLSPSTDLG